MEVLTLGGGSRDWQILDNYTKPKLHRSCQTFSQYLHFGFKYTVFFHWFWGFSPIWPSSTSITPSVLSQPKPPIYHSIIWIFPPSLIDDRWSTCAGPEIHFSFSFFHSFLTLIHTSLSRRFWLFLSSSCILPHARFMTVWRLIQTLTGHLTFWEEEVGRRQVHSCCTLHILHWRVRGTFNNSFYFLSILSYRTWHTA